MKMTAFRDLKTGDRVRFGSKVGTVRFAGASYHSFCVGVVWDGEPENSYQRNSWFNENDSVRRLRIL